MYRAPVKLLDLRGAPKDPVERAAWLGGVLDKVKSELDEAYAQAYGEARLTGRFEDALRLGPLSRTRALAATRRFNHRQGSAIRWGDGGA